ncbi:MAG TPA: hypothetical protein VNM68_03900 [Candidatus Polarisedimenticolia bacterium]|jgi:hypothetical protein|nr:hypothetical protein [Candidatus Polarisedimenticolia bacterium]
MDVVLERGIFGARASGLNSDRIENAEALDRLRPVIGEQRKRDPVLAAEGSEDCRRVVADCGQAEALASKFA